MIGNLILWIKEIIKQEFFCIHRYENINRKDLQGGSFLECNKCGKIIN
jgi:hypothetical protein